MGLCEWLKPEAFWAKAHVTIVTIPCPSGQGNSIIASPFMNSIALYE
jgi:hypothetical protein